MNARIIHGLLWREWLLHHVTLTWIFSVWLLGIWVFPIHPLYFLLPFGILSALLIAPTFGGSDASEGSEEFSFALPPTRSQRYVVRLALGGGILASLLLVGVAAAAFDLPQKLWGLIFDSGFTVPFSGTKHNWVYALSVVVPMAIFSECFAAGSSCRTPEATRLLWLRGLFVVGILVGGSFFAEHLVFGGKAVGIIACSAPAVWGLARLLYGYRDYKYKEGVSGLPRLAPRSASRVALWLIIILLVMALAAAFFVAGSARSPEPASVPMETHPPVKVKED